MSVVRLEITVPDADAGDVADRLAAGYSSVIGDGPYAHVVVEIRTDAVALRDRVILQAAGYFVRGEYAAVTELPDVPGAGLGCRP